jgi:hypothetical protein
MNLVRVQFKKYSSWMFTTTLFDKPSYNNRVVSRLTTIGKRYHLTETTIYKLVIFKIIDYECTIMFLNSN